MLRIHKTIIFSLLLGLLSLAAPLHAAQPIKIAIDAEFGIPGSTSAQAIEHGAQVAVNEINADGGLLGRKLVLVIRDNRAVPARSRNNLRELAADPYVVAVFCGRYSPAVIELLPEIQRLKLPLLDPWAAADPITANPATSSYVFRLSLRDSWALQVMMRYATSMGAQKVGLLVPNTSWGRSSMKAAERVASDDTKQIIVGAQWYDWGDASLMDHYQALRRAGAEALVFVANDQEGAILTNEIAALPKDERLPIVTHWGIAGGDFFDKTSAALSVVDLTVVQTYSFIGKKDAHAKRVLAGLKAVTGSDDPRKVVSAVGVAHAYDLVQLLAMAIRQAGSTNREAVRDALENLGPYDGLVRKRIKPFTAERHDALSINEVFMARYAEDGAIEPMVTPDR